MIAYRAWSMKKRKSATLTLVNLFAILGWVMLLYVLFVVVTNGNGIIQRPLENLIYCGGK